MVFWKRAQHSSYMTGVGRNTNLDLVRIDQRVDKLEYNGVMDFVADIQSMLKSAAQHFGFSFEVRLSLLLVTYTYWFLVCVHLLFLLKPLMKLYVGLQTS